MKYKIYRGASSRGAGDSGLERRGSEEGSKDRRSRRAKDCARCLGFLTLAQVRP